VPQRFVEELNAVDARALGDRFSFYAKRIQTLILNRYNLEGSEELGSRLVIDPYVLLVWARTDGVFPQIHKLTIDEGFMDLPLSASILNNLFERTRLTALSIYLDGEHVAAFGSIRSQILEACANLEELEVVTMTTQAQENRDEWASLLHTMLARTVCLNDFGTTLPIAYNDLMHVAQQPSLRKLTIHGPIFDIPQDSSILPSGAFQKLHTLEVEDQTSSARPTQSLLAFTSAHCLTSCTLNISPEIGIVTEDVYAILQLLSQHESLRNVSVIIAAELDSALSAETAKELMGILHSLTKLTYLCLSLRNDFPINSIVISDLLCACPCLRSWYLAVRGEQSNKRPTRLTMPFESFLDMLKNHQSLKDIPVCVYPPVLPLAELKATFDPQQYGSSLVVEYIEDTRQLQKVVSEMLPRVQTVSVLQPDGPPHEILMNVDSFV
jgi:hypothetical protein